jgi:hypothetical protein
MKNLKEIILEKLIINKDTSVPDKLHKTFANVEDLVNAFNEFFGSNLKHDIVINYDRGYFPKDGKSLGMGQEVSASFMIEFKDDTVIRCGLVLGKKRLLMGVGHKTGRTIEYDELLTPFAIGYNFGKDNFEDWLENLSQEKFKLLKEKFIDK